MIPDVCGVWLHAARLILLTCTSPSFVWSPVPGEGGGAWPDCIAVLDYLWQAWADMKRARDRQHPPPGCSRKHGDGGGDWRETPGLLVVLGFLRSMSVRPSPTADPEGSQNAFLITYVAPW